MGLGSRSEPSQFPFGASRERKEGLRGVASHGNHHPAHASPLNEYPRISIGTEEQNERCAQSPWLSDEGKKHRLVKEYLYLSIPWVILTAWNFTQDFTVPMSTGSGLAFLLLPKKTTGFQTDCLSACGTESGPAFSRRGCLAVLLLIILGCLFSLLSARRWERSRFLSLLKA